jgi:hypothetical protein
MPKLKYLFVNATTPELRLLRGKTIECISLIGLAVGKDKFLVDCQDVMETLLRTQTNFDNLEDEDPQVIQLFVFISICEHFLVRGF